MTKSITVTQKHILVQGKASDFPSLAKSTAMKRWMEQRNSIPAITSEPGWDGRKS